MSRRVMDEAGKMDAYRETLLELSPAGEWMADEPAPKKKHGSFREWAKVCYKTDGWLAQTERKRSCLWNLTMRGRGYDPCSVPDERCAECRAHEYIPLWLDSFVAGGAAEIMRMQQRRGRTK